MTDKPTWIADPCGKFFTRSDGATASWHKTPTGQRPWRGSHWHRGGWKVNWRSNVATAQTAMDNIDRHWPDSMG